MLGSPGGGLTLEVLGGPAFGMPSRGRHDRAIWRDEFAILLDGMSDVKDATRLTERLLKTFGHCFSIDGREVFASASIGITMMNPRYTRAEDLLRDADAAMYRAKAEGRARLHVFDVDMHVNALAQLQLETELRRASNVMSFPSLQTSVTLADNHVDAVESLSVGGIRAGLIQPAEFIHWLKRPASSFPGAVGVQRQLVGSSPHGGVRVFRVHENVNSSAQEFATTNLAARLKRPANEAACHCRRWARADRERGQVGHGAPEET